jgi:hypothetical protein
MPCRSPFWIERVGRPSIPVPCGKCPICRRRRLNDWVFRLKQEDKVAESSYFITLTYNTDHVPLCNNGMTLDPNDLTKFFKRIRKYGENIRYYAVGEYGSKSWRPHYHIILFNLKDLDHIFKGWKLGSIHIGDVTSASIGYTCKYLDKQKKVPAYAGDTRVKEFSRMSKGLGKNYYEDKNVFKAYKGNIERTSIHTEEGYRIPMPRYYRDKFLSDNEKKAQRLFIDKEVKILSDINEKQWNTRKKGYDYEHKLALLQTAEWNKFIHNIKNRDKL